MKRSTGKTAPRKNVKPPMKVAPPSGKAAVPAHLTLEASCTLREAADMQFMLLSATFDGTQILIDGGNVERIDTAGLQLLVAFKRTQQDAGRQCQWLRASTALKAAAGRLGLLKPLDIPADDLVGEGS